MNAETVQRWLKRLMLFMAKVVNSMLLQWWWLPPPSSSNGRNWSLTTEAANNNTTPWHTVLLMMSTQKRRTSHFEDGLYSERRGPCAVFLFNVNIFNFPRQSFPRSLILAPLLAILLSFLQSSGTSPPPFELRPLAFTVSVACSVAYYFTLPTTFMFPGFASQLEVLMSAFGCLAVATLISLILHLPWWSIFIILLFMGSFLKLLNKLHATYGYMRRPQPRMMQPLLPLYNVIFRH